MDGTSFPLSRSLSSEQLSKVKELRRLLERTGSWEIDNDEHDCVRFLKARKWDLALAAKMWEGCRMWRRENRVDTIHKWFVFPERANVDLVFPTGLHMTDKEGRPVLIQQLGRVNIASLYTFTSEERIRLAHIAENEHLRRTVFPACSRLAGRQVDQLFTVIDLDRLAFTSLVRTTGLLKMFMQMDSNNYPEMLGHMVIINAPGWFSTSWRALKGALDGETVRKIEILGTDYTDTLLRHIPREHLLAQYGGTSRGLLTANIGPWLEPPAPPPLPPPPTPPLLLPLAKPPAGDAHRPGGAAHTDKEPGPDDGAPPAGADQGSHPDASDAPARRSQSPVRPGARPTAAAASTPYAHLSPPARAPLGTPLHQGLGPSDPHPGPQRAPPAGQQQQPHHHQQQQQAGSSPTGSISDASSDAALSMAAPLLSNFLASDAAAPLPSQRSPPPLAGAAGRPLPGVQPEQLAAGPSPQPECAGGVATPPSRRGSCGGTPVAARVDIPTGILGVGVLTAAAHAASSGHPPCGGPLGAPAPSAVDGGILHPLAAARAAPAGAWAGGGAAGQQGSPPLQAPPAQQEAHSLAPHAAAAQQPPVGAGGAVQLQPLPASAGLARSASPLPAAGAAQCPQSIRSPGSFASPGSPAMRPHRTGSGGGDGGAAGLAASLGPFGPLAMMATRASGGGAAAGLGSGGGLAGMGSSLLTPAASQLQQQASPAGTAADYDDAESVRMSVMSNRSFYSALSHAERSSSSGLTSPSEASEHGRRWLLQRELHAAAIASALAATADQRAAVAAAASARVAAAAKGSGPAGPGCAGGAPAQGAMAVPAVQQAFGSYLDAPPPYGMLAGSQRQDAAAGGGGHAAPAGGSGSGGAGTDPLAPAASSLGGQCLGGRTHAGQVCDVHARCAAGRGAEAAGERFPPHHHSDGAAGGGAGRGGGGGGGGMSRSPSTATVDECGPVGVEAAVSWARGWFFRRRSYGRLIEADALAAHGAQLREGGGGGRPPGASHARTGSAGRSYASMQEGPDGAAPGEEAPPKGALGGGGQQAHQAHAEAWEWDREASHGSRGGERRRLLPAEGQGRRRSLMDGLHCRCLPCCVVS